MRSAAQQIGALGRYRDQLSILRELQSPALFVYQPVVPATQGLLPNSTKRVTIRAPSFLARVSAGGAALDGVQSGRAEALPQLLARRSRSRKARRSTSGRCR